MNIRKIIRESIDDLDWIRDIKPNSITHLQPNDEFYIVHISGQALEDYLDDYDLRDYDVYGTLFKMDEEGCFEDAVFNRYDTYEYGVTKVWLRTTNPRSIGAWVSIDTILVEPYNLK